MKKVRLSVAMLFAAWSLAGTTGAFADNGTIAGAVKVVKVENKKVRLYTPLNAAVSVSMIDADGNTLYQEQLTAKDLRGLSFNLKSLPDGQYFITATNDTFWLSQALTVRGNDLIVSDKSVSLLEKPMLTPYAANKFEVIVPATNVANVNVSIYNQQNDLVFTDQIKAENARRFDLSTLPAGDYTFVMGDDQKQFAQHVQIKH